MNVVSETPVDTNDSSISLAKEAKNKISDTIEEMKEERLQQDADLEEEWILYSNGHSKNVSKVVQNQKGRWLERFPYGIDPTHPR